MEIIFFGPFRLRPSERVLKKGDQPVKLGSRAFDILLVLVQHVGEVVGHKELVAKVWPDVFVEEVSLRVHIAALRKALDTGEAGARYLINVRGRGYCFVAPTSREWVESSVPAAEMSFDAVYHVCNNASLRKAARRLGKLYDAVLEPSGLKATQFNLLTQIHALGRPTMAGLANSLLTDLSALRRSLGPLGMALSCFSSTPKTAGSGEWFLRPAAWRNSSKPHSFGERRRAALKKRSAPRARRSSALS